MKKIMIAALAAVAVGAANAACEKPNECVFAYRFKMAGKTVAAKVKADSGACAKTTNCWAKAASLRIAGYVWDVAAKDPTAGSTGCCDCSGFGLLVQNKAVFWTVKYDSTGKETKPQIWKDIQDVDFSAFEVLRNSGAKDKAQMWFDIDGIQFAGFGSYNPETKRLKRANGFFAGVFTSYLAECETCDPQPMPAAVFAPCTLVEAPTAFKIAYGRWNLAWKHEKVAALEKGAYSSVTVNGLDVPSVLLPSAFVAEQ